MDIATYMREASRCDNHTETGLLDGLVHGVQAEAGEVLACVLDGWTGDELLHELGDVAWGLGQISRATGYDPSRIPIGAWAAGETGLRGAAALAKACSRLSGVLEKSHRKTHSDMDVRGTLRTHLHDAWQALSYVTWIYGYTMPQVMAANLDKLSARYAERGLPTKEAS